MSGVRDSASDACSGKGRIARGLAMWVGIQK